MRGKRETRGGLIGKGYMTASSNSLRCRLTLFVGVLFALADDLGWYRDMIVGCVHQVGSG